MKIVDLQHVCYREVYGLLQRLCEEDDVPFLAVTGDSQMMKATVKNVVACWGLFTKEKLGNGGCLIVCESR